MNGISYKWKGSDYNFKMLELEYNHPNNFDSNLLIIKSEYLKSREAMGNESLLFKDKLIRLASIATIIDDNCDIFTAQYYAWSILNLGEIYLLLTNPQVREIFSNKIGMNLTIKHEIYNHCQVNLRFTEELWSALKLQSELNANKVLSFMSPTLKTGIKTELGNLRITLQQEPLTSESPSFVIRRLPDQPISLEKLIDQHQISPVFGDVLLSMISERKNIIIAGEPGSGKTTLANALLLESFPQWRTIIYEDASEIQLPKDKFPLLQHYNIPSLDYQKTIIDRKTEITKLLHRSPDYVFLGEIQNSDDTASMFEVFSAGVRGIATTHARNFNSLLSRWEISYKITNDIFQVLDAIVITSRDIDDKSARIYVSDLYINVEGSFQRINAIPSFVK